MVDRLRKSSVRFGSKSDVRFGWKADLGARVSIDGLKRRGASRDNNKDLEPVAARGVDDLSGDPAAVRPGKETGDIRDVLRLTNPLQRLR